MVLQRHDEGGEAVGHDEADSWKVHCLRRSLYHLNLDENLLKSRHLELDKIHFYVKSHLANLESKTQSFWQF